jgi:hypothetical protein
MATNAAGVRELSDEGGSGTRLGTASTDLIGFLGATPITQQTAGTAAPEIDPTVSGSALVASIHSIAIGAASLANVNAQVLASFGFTT